MTCCGSSGLNTATRVAPEWDIVSTAIPTNQRGTSCSHERTLKADTVRWLIVYSLLGCCLFTSFGCLTFVYAESTYFGRKEEIRNTHAAITGSGRVVDDAGKQ